MGYELHVTRRTHWSDDQGAGIALQEWLALVEQDPELRLDGFARVDMGNGYFIRVNDESIAVWIAHPNFPQVMAWISRSVSGNLEAKNPDSTFTAKLWRIAHQLGAKVEGDHGEIYGPDGKAVAPTR